MLMESKFNALSIDTLSTSFFLLAAVMGAFWDYRTSRIPNAITIPTLFCALAYSHYVNGISGLISATLAVLIAFAIFFPLFLLHVMGAGDGKLVMALGAYLGWQDTLKFIGYAIASAAVASLVIIILNGRYKAFVKELLLFLRSILVPNLAIHWPRLDHKSKGPFGVFVFVGFLLTLAKL